MLLSMVVVNTDPDAKRNEGRYSNLRNLDGDERLFIRHSLSTESDARQQHVEGLSSKAIDPELSREQFIKHLANIHWLMANAMLDHRGSAAKTALFIRALTKQEALICHPSSTLCLRI